MMSKATFRSSNGHWTLPNTDAIIKNVRTLMSGPNNLSVPNINALVPGHPSLPVIRTLELPTISYVSSQCPSPNHRSQTTGLLPESHAEPCAKCYCQNRG